jgi:uncharacterized alpha-E superfamily protein
MTQDAGWRLLRIGRRLERLQFGCDLLAQHITSSTATRQRNVEWLLEAYDSMRIYRARYALAPQLGAALDLLVRDTEHPGSLGFLTRALARDLLALSISLRTSVDGAAEEALDADTPELSDENLLSLESPAREGEAARQSLAVKLRAIAGAAGALSDRLTMRHFAHISLNTQALAT